MPTILYNNWSIVMWPHSHHQSCWANTQLEGEMAFLPSFHQGRGSRRRRRRLSRGNYYFILLQIFRSLFCFCFETGSSCSPGWPPSHYGAEKGLELWILLPPQVFVICGTIVHILGTVQMQWFYSFIFFYTLKEPKNDCKTSRERNYLWHKIEILTLLWTWIVHTAFSAPASLGVTSECLYDPLQFSWLVLKTLWAESSVIEQHFLTSCCCLRRTSL